MSATLLVWISLTLTTQPPALAASGTPHVGQFPDTPFRPVAFGDAHFYGSTGSVALNHPVVGLAAAPDNKGYWLVASDGGVFSFGDAHFYGSTGSVALNHPVVAMAAAPDNKGYWLVVAGGDVFGFDDAHLYGTTASSQALVGMAATPDGKGYWLVASDGGVFSFGDAHFHGSMGGQKLTNPVAAIASTSDGGGSRWVPDDTETVAALLAARPHNDAGAEV
jgi:hypothetical protein